MEHALEVARQAERRVEDNPSLGSADAAAASARHTIGSLSCRHGSRPLTRVCVHTRVTHMTSVHVRTPVPNARTECVVPGVCGLSRAQSQRRG